jgi:cyanate lyase
LPTPPTGEQNQKKRTFDVLPKPDKFIRYRQEMSKKLSAGGLRRWRPWPRLLVGRPSRLTGKTPQPDNPARPAKRAIRRERLPEPPTPYEVSSMKREQLVEKILDIKREKGWSWKYISEEIGGMSPILVVGALLGQMKLPKPLAERAASLFGLTEGEKRMLNEVPTRGVAMPPTDPLIYRLYELIMVNGPALKALIEEEFGDGIMSAIDFDLEFDRASNPKGDRVRLVMSGKFLPYKYYGAEQGVPEYGFKEE